MLTWKYLKSKWLLLDHANEPSLLECLGYVHQLRKKKIEGFCYKCGWNPTRSKLQDARKELVDHVVNVHDFSEAFIQHKYCMTMVRIDSLDVPDVVLPEGKGWELVCTNVTFNLDTVQRTFCWTWKIGMQLNHDK